MAIISRFSETKYTSLHLNLFWHIGVVVKDIAVGVQRLGLDSRSGQIGHNDATAAVFLRSCIVQALSRGDRSRRPLHALAFYRECNEDSN